MPKRYLNCAGNSDMHRWIEDNPWNKTWKPAWRNLAQEQRNQILNAQRKKH